MRTTIARAIKGYDEEFCAQLSLEIATAIGNASMAVDAPIVAIRTGETIDALVSALVAIISMSPEAANPAALRKLSENIAKQIRRDAAACKDDPGITEMLSAKPPGMSCQ